MGTTASDLSVEFDPVISSKVKKQVRHDFTEHGWLRIPAIGPHSVLDELTQKLWVALGKAYEIKQDDSTTWLSEDNSKKGLFEYQGAIRVSKFRNFELGLDKSKPAKELRAFTDSVVEQVFPERDWVGNRRGRPLINFPNYQYEWQVPNKVWHSDSVAIPTSTDPNALIVFWYLADVEQHGGATLLLDGFVKAAVQFIESRGSENIPKKPKALLRQMASEDEWLRELVNKRAKPHGRDEKFGDPYKLGECSVQVVELTGERYDCVIFNPSCIHTLSSNHKSPRLIYRYDYSLFNASLPQ